VIENNEQMSVVFDERFLDYHAPPGMFDATSSPYLGKQIDQPEGSDRILNTVSTLKNSVLNNRIHWLSPIDATDEQILMFHTPEYLNRLADAQKEANYFTASTYMVKDGMSFIRLSAGAAIVAAEQVVQGATKIGYAISRPPSHHAQPDEADGYCFVNGVGLAAHHALANGFKRVAVIDWDVHHGNGTQAGFYDRSDVLTISMHMDHGSWGSTHLQTGDVSEMGTGEGEGYNINLPLPFGAGDATYDSLFRRCIQPTIEKFAPDLIVIANGQDANQFDPNGRQCLTMAGFYSMAKQVRAMADAHTQGKIVMTQEGGYNPTYAPFCAYAVAAGMLNQPMEMVDPIALYPDNLERSERDVDELIARHPLF
jgi:acetoin utilization deacetylase AcuC-like enzyme